MHTYVSQANCKKAAVGKMAWKDAAKLSEKVCALMCSQVGDNTRD